MDVSEAKERVCRRGWVEQPQVCILQLFSAQWISLVSLAVACLIRLQSQIWSDSWGDTFFSWVISLLSFILSFVICSKYTEFHFLFLCKSMSRRLHWLIVAPTRILLAAGWKYHLIWGGSWGQVVTQDPAMLKVCLQLELRFLAWWQK